MRPLLGRTILLLLVLSLAILPSIAAVESSSIHVILLFDTEDYLLPADDDATKRLAEMLAERNIRATLKLVGEKARLPEQRGPRGGVLALRNAGIGYQRNFP